METQNNHETGNLIDFLIAAIILGIATISFAA